ncbi:MAG: CPBP family intramembrane metalloprotease [Spirochaetales bacterium]|nr:CPBP family intramembrane metalloprotease [Spirochaetales bacterium]
MPAIISGDPGKKIVLVLVSGMVLVLYTYLIPPLLSADSISRFPVFTQMAFDLPQYFWRFFLSFTLLGLIPVLTASIFGYSPSMLGFRKMKVRKPFLFWSVLILLAIVFGTVSRFDKQIAAYYPYTKAFPALINQYGFWSVLLHPVCYFLLFYIPWEFLFRGILIFPFLDGKNDLLIASFQALPSALLHFGHPFGETFSALFFGLAAAVICIKTRSFIPVLVFHAIVGITLDLVLILSSVPVA